MVLSKGNKVSYYPSCNVAVYHLYLTHRKAGIPEKYCAEVSRRITAPPTSFTFSSSLQNTLYHCVYVCHFVYHINIRVCFARRCG